MKDIMFKVPFYSFQNYQQVIGKSYDEQDRSEWISLEDVFAMMTPEFVSRFA